MYNCVLSLCSGRSSLKKITMFLQFFYNPNFADVALFVVHLCAQKFPKPNKMFMIVILLKLAFYMPGMTRDPIIVISLIQAVPRSLGFRVVFNFGSQRLLDAFSDYLTSPALVVPVTGCNIQMVPLI